MFIVSRLMEEKMSQKYIIEQKIKAPFMSTYKTYTIETESLEDAKKQVKSIAKSLYSFYGTKTYFELRLVKLEEVGLFTGEDLYNEIQEERQREQNKKDYEQYLLLKKRFEHSSLEGSGN